MHFVRFIDLIALRVPLNDRKIITPKNSIRDEVNYEFKKLRKKLQLVDDMISCRQKR